ncbi:PEP-CTERM/exosortase system-associated acyltransferase [Alteromonas profundi]|nr:PEP-CTERM/exosortase system-associated acyltransferase [Alteromonas profundi]
MDHMTVAENFEQYFSLKVANTPELKQESYRIRHQVYSEELGWEPTRPDGMETDECDAYSIALLLQHKRTGHYAGTARLVLPPPHDLTKKLPFELHCLESVNKEVIDPSTLTRGTFGEISRLAVPAEFRRRVGEKNQSFVINENVASSPDIFTDEDRRNFPNIAIGLYLGVIALVNMCHHPHMFVVVEPRLNKRLRRLGLHFKQCGCELDYHGTRALFVLDQSDYYTKLNVEMLNLFKLVENQLREQLILYPVIPLTKE